MTDHPSRYPYTPVRPEDLGNDRGCEGLAEALNKLQSRRKLRKVRQFLDLNYAAIRAIESVKSLRERRYLRQLLSNHLRNTTDLVLEKDLLDRCRALIRHRLVEQAERDAAEAAHQRNLQRWNAYFAKEKSGRVLTSAEEAFYG